MDATAAQLLAPWQNFYVIVGSSAGALTGLMFVVITLASELRTSGEPLGAFGTPNVVHFGAALLVSAMLNAPWQSLWHVAVILGVLGVAGTIYVGIAARRAVRQTEYVPVLEDWLWHTIFPMGSYVALLVAAFVLPGNPTPALFLVGAAAVLLLFIGIHNAWDSVTYVVIERAKREKTS